MNIAVPLLSTCLEKYFKAPVVALFLLSYGPAG